MNPGSFSCSESVQTLIYCGRKGFILVKTYSERLADFIEVVNDRSVKELQLSLIRDDVLLELEAEFACLGVRDIHIFIQRIIVIQLRKIYEVNWVRLSPVLARLSKRKVRGNVVLPKVQRALAFHDPAQRRRLRLILSFN